MKDASYSVGDWVVSNNHPHWGPGQVIADVGIRHTDGSEGPFLRIDFGHRQFHLEPDELSLYQPPPTPRPALVPPPTEQR